MKKQLLFLAGSAILFASCGSSNNQAQTQAQIDSTVNAKLNEHDQANAAKNDSTLKAIEKEKAEASHREHEHSGKKEEGNNTAPTPTPTVAATPVQPAGPRDHAAQQNGAVTAQPGAPASGPRAHAAQQNQGK